MNINDYNFAGKKAIVRVDFNVPLQDGKITDDTRIRGAVPTLKLILEKGGALIIMSHMGKPKGKVKPELSLGQIKDAVAKALGVAEVKFAPDCAKADAEAKAAQFEGVKLSITAKVSDGKNIYGSVGAPQLAEALAAMGLEVNPKQIAFKAVKELGSYVAPVHFHREVTVQIPFDVVNEEGLTTPKKEKVEEAPAVAETADAIDSIEDMEDLVEAEAEAEAKAEAEAEA